MPTPAFRPRRPPLAAACAALLLAAPTAAEVPADSLATVRPPVRLLVEPAAPCARDSLTLVALNPCRPCYEIVSLARAGDGRLLLEFTQTGPAACAATPCAPARRSLGLGRFPAGRHALDVEVVWHLPPDSVSATGGVRFLREAVGFEVARCGRAPARRDSAAAPGFSAGPRAARPAVR